MIINDTVTRESVNIKHATFYKLKQRNPRLVELLKKGLVAEQVLNKSVFEDMIKKANKE